MPTGQLSDGGDFYSTLVFSFGSLNFILYFYIHLLHYFSLCWIVSGWLGYIRGVCKTQTTTYPTWEQYVSSIWPSVTPLLKGTCLWSIELPGLQVAFMGHSSLCFYSDSMVSLPLPRSFHVVVGYLALYVSQSADWTEKYMDL